MIKMIKNLLIFIIILLFSHSGYADVTKGYMNCTIKSQNITQIKDGKTNVFNGYKGDYLQVGDSLKLEYAFYYNDNEIYFKMSNKKRTFIFNIGDLVKGETRLDAKGMIFLVTKSYGINSEIRLTKNFIIFRDSATFNRYYKDDWMGITGGTTRTNNSVNNETISWDCKHSGNSTLTDLYDSLKRYLDASN